MKTNNIDLLRVERRFFIILPFLKSFLGRIVKDFRQKKFSQDVVQNIYLGDDEQTIPWGTSVKARRYLSSFSNPRENVNLSDRFLLDIKRQNYKNWQVREKQPRVEMSLKEIISTSSDLLKTPLRPYVMVEYRRQHFFPLRDIPLRVTVDSGMRFYFFPSDGITFLGEESGLARVECKFTEGYEKDESVLCISDLLQKSNAQPIISKKEAAYNFVRAYLSSKSARPLIKELPGCEIEAKLTLQSHQPVNFFLGMKNWCRDGKMPLIIESHFPFTFLPSSLNHYWGRYTDKGLEEGIKVLFRGNEFNTVLKGDMQIISPSLAIVKRSEIKGRATGYNPEAFQKMLRGFEKEMGKLDFMGYLHRSRRAFWPANPISGRFYHISLDLCLVPGKPPLFQLEVEYSGIHHNMPTPNRTIAEREIVDDTVNITQSILRLAEEESIHLCPDVLSKFDWLTRT